jgi:SAM-dependent methyltransferase
VVVSERPAAPTPAVVVWHDIECGGYSVDLPLWRELAERCDGPILDVGAGSGRVTLDLARFGHSLTALDREAALLTALRQRAAALDVRTVCADARSFDLRRRDFALCLVPMQTIQLLGGAEARVEFLRSARAHLRPGALIACAILGQVEPFDCSTGGAGPAAERAEIDGLLYLSRATRVAETPKGVIIERQRQILSQRSKGDDAFAPQPELNLIELDRLDAATLRSEGAAIGLHLEPTHEIAATEEHVGSEVVIFRV